LAPYRKSRLRRVFLNLLLLAGLTTAGFAASFLIGIGRHAGPMDNLPSWIFFAALVFFPVAVPGALLYLGLLALLPSSWQGWHKRTAAVGLSPVTGIGWWLLLWNGDFSDRVAVLVVFLGIVLVYGATVQLPNESRGID